MDAFRAINEIVFALLFVVAVGLGPLAGVLALAVHNVGIIAKLFSEAVEAIDPRPVEGIRVVRRDPAAGGDLRRRPAGHAALVVVHALSLRDQCALGHGSRHRRRRRHRPARSMRTSAASNYAETAAIIIIVVATVMLIDMLSARIRAGLV